MESSPSRRLRSRASRCVVTSAANSSRQNTAAPGSFCAYALARAASPTQSWTWTRDKMNNAGGFPCPRAQI